MRFRFLSYDIDLSFSVSRAVKYTEEEIIELDRRIVEHMAVTPEKIARFRHLDLEWELSATRKICRMLANGERRELCMWNPTRGCGISSDTFIHVFTCPLSNLGAQETNNPICKVISKWRQDVGVKVYNKSGDVYHYKYKHRTQTLERDYGFIKGDVAY